MTRLASQFGPRLGMQAPYGEFLSLEEMQARLPAIFAPEAHHSRSDRYAYIPTMDILAGLAKEGFHPTFAAQAIPRKEDRFGFTKHMLRLRHERDLRAREHVNEIVALNSHGGETSFQMFSGVFRFICLNSMVCGQTYDEIRVRHSGNIVPDVIASAYRVVDSFAPINESIDRMKAIELRPAEQMAFAESAAILRLDTQEGERPAVASEQFLRPRRSADVSSDLWTTFNRVQENTIVGGLHGRTVDANNRRRNMTTRPVNGIDQNVKLNRALWSLAERMAELKLAA